MNDFFELSGFSGGATTGWTAPYAIVCPLCGRTDVTSRSTVELDTAAPWVFGAVRRLESLGRLQHGWDSHRGRPLKPKAKDLTIQTIQWLNREDLPVPNVALGSDGTVQLEWRVGGKELDIDVGDGDVVEYVKYDRQGNTEEGRVEQNTPDELCGLAQWLLHS
jgi:hypothetical protein